MKQFVTKNYANQQIKFRDKQIYILQNNLKTALKTLIEIKEFPWSDERVNCLKCKARQAIDFIDKMKGGET